MELTVSLTFTNLPMLRSQGLLTRGRFFYINLALLWVGVIYIKVSEYSIKTGAMVFVSRPQILGNKSSFSTKEKAPQMRG
jgi:hypothetical protein